MKKLALIALLLVVAAAPAEAQLPKLENIFSTGGDATAAGRIVQLILVLTVLSVAPGLLIMVTSFTRFVVALSFLRAGLGLQTTPANLILISLSLFMTFYVMAPTFDQAWQNGVQPLMENKIDEQEAYQAYLRRRSATSCWPTCARRIWSCSRTWRRPAAARTSAREPARRRKPVATWTARPDSGVHDLGAPPRLRDRLSDRAAVPRHRPDRGDAHHVDGHDDDAADGHLACRSRCCSSC